MDVLAYSAFNSQIQLNQQLVDKTSCLATKCSETADQQAAASSLDAASICWVQCVEPCLLREPYRTSFYACIPSLSGATEGFKVCDTSAQFNCGRCCQWTVPAGVTRARFQLWGAGGMSGAGCCCGGSPFGSTGAYASVIIPVSEGDTYTLCSGCAFCCFTYSTSGSQRIPGCPSWVQGNGLCNFCANGGQGNLGNWMAALGRTPPTQISIPGFACGSRICNSGGDFCSSSTCSNTGGIICYVPGASYFGTATSTSSPSIVYGVRGMWPGICFDTNHYGCQCHPPIYGFTSTSQCIIGWTSGTCCGYNCRAAAGYLQFPGAGGWATIAMGGNYATCGDMGRMGMVCVTYC